ncbi:1-acylglycerol-3-phosphate O-acyltransferase [Desulforegula conservatrix]|uniref:1-acylglycerol-3-phosphate O-acyltransferase n=1 Tax=Desulforegula conservatrix TaxID=153026 RepID=UPI000421ABB0|nr:1-acylglycerol-3-phosphate O-acyltransferase [Desulforegula conservatrix]
MLYPLRVFLIILYFILVAAIGILICLIRPFHPDNTRWFGRIYSWGGAAILGIKIRRHNYDSLKNIGPCVYVVNHQDNFDLFVTGSVMPKRTVTIGKKNLRYLPFFGQLYWLSGNIFIDRKNSSNSKVTMSASTQALTTKNKSIWVFAEGTRNRGKNMLPFKKGAFKMAIEAGVPVVPICVSSYVSNMDLKRLRSVKAEIKVLPPIKTENLTIDDIETVIKECWDTMKTTIEQMDKETYAF